MPFQLMAAPASPKCSGLPAAPFGFQEGRLSQQSHSDPADVGLFATARMLHWPPYSCPPPIPKKWSKLFEFFRIPRRSTTPLPFQVFMSVALAGHSDSLWPPPTRCRHPPCKRFAVASHFTATHIPWNVQLASIILLPRWIVLVECERDLHSSLLMMTSIHRWRLRCTCGPRCNAPRSTGALMYPLASLQVV